MTTAIGFAAALPIKQKLGTTWGLLAGTSFFIVTEWFWTHGPIAMPGTLLGHAFSSSQYVNQIVDLNGVAGLSLWILGVNAGLFLMLDAAHRRRTALVVCFVFFLLAPVGYSIIRLQTDMQSQSDTQIAMVQPGVPSTHWADENDRARVSRMIQLTDSLLQMDLTNANTLPDLVLWPETTIPRISQDDTLLTRLQQWTASSGFALLTGAIIRTDEGNTGTRQTNSALLIDGYAPIQRYDKNWLVPFAEHVPFEQTINQLENLRVDAGGVAGYQAGDEQVMLEMDNTKVGSFKIGALICFESLFGDYTRTYIRDDAAFLVALSNIGWWGPNPAPAHYLNFSRLRAIETRSYLAINTVTGPAAIIDNQGKIVQDSKWMERALVTGSIPHTSKKTLYVRYGDWLRILAIFTAIYILIRYFFVRKKLVAATRSP